MVRFQGLQRYFVVRVPVHAWAWTTAITLFEMSDGARCTVAYYYAVRVSSAVMQSREWQVRVTNGGGFRSHRGWQWDSKIRERAGGLDGPPELTLLRCDADIPFARSVGELRYAQGFVRRSAADTWTLSLSLFDERSLKGIKLVTAGQIASEMRPDRMIRRDERRWRHD